MSDKPVAEMSFEEAMAALEQVVGALERGEVPLEQSIALYERGAALKAHCAKKLAEAHKAGKLEFDQLILETSRNIVHISFDPEGGTRKQGMRGDVLTQKLGAGTPFQQGIVG